MGATARNSAWQHSGRKSLSMQRPSPWPPSRLAGRGRSRGWAGSERCTTPGCWPWSQQAPLPGPGLRETHLSL